MIKEKLLHYHNFDKLSQIVENLAKKNHWDIYSQKMVLFNLWDEIIGSRFKKSTKPYKIKNNKLIVLTKSVMISQELEFQKKYILENISKFTKNLDIKITNIVFDHLNWLNVQDVQKINKKIERIKYLPAPNEEDIKNIKLPENLIENIENSLKNSQNLTEEMKKKIINTVLSDIKRQIWKKENNYPVCEKCGMVLDYIEQKEGTILCRVCSSEENTKNFYNN